MRRKKFVLLCYIGFDLKFQMIPLRLKQMNQTNQKSQKSRMNLPKRQKCWNLRSHLTL